MILKIQSPSYIVITIDYGSSTLSPTGHTESLSSTFSVLYYIVLHQVHVQYAYVCGTPMHSAAEQPSVYSTSPLSPLSTYSTNQIEFCDLFGTTKLTILRFVFFLPNGMGCMRTPHLTPAEKAEGPSTSSR